MPGVEDWVSERPPDEDLKGHVRCVWRPTSEANRERSCQMRVSTSCGSITARCGCAGRRQRHGRSHCHAARPRSGFDSARPRRRLRCVWMPARFATPESDARPRHIRTAVRSAPSRRRAGAVPGVHGSRPASLTVEQSAKRHRVARFANTSSRSMMPNARSGRTSKIRLVRRNSADRSGASAEYRLR